MVIQRVASVPPTQSPLLSKDVLYIGSAVPLETSKGLDAIQQPLRSRYPVHDEDSIQGILATLTVTPTGIQLRYQSDTSHVVFFPFSSLSLCAAVRCVKTTNATTNEMTSRFVSLTDAASEGTSTNRPTIFTTITRRTKGRQVLECHGFITVTPRDAMDLVQWTSRLDKKYKQEGGAAIENGNLRHTNGASSVAGFSTNTIHDVSRFDTSFRGGGGDTASLPEYPVNLIAGEPMVHTAAQGFYNEAPKEGYFYSTKKAQVKKFSLHQFGGTSGGEEVGPPSSDHFEGGKSHLENSRAEYAGSHYSLPVSRHPPMMSPRPVPVPMHPMHAPMHPAHTMVRPVLVPGPPRPTSPPSGMMYVRPRFFSPPPPSTMMRAQPVPVFIPPPQHPHHHPGVPMYNGGVHGYTLSRNKSKGRSSRHSSSSRSSSTSSDREKRAGGKKHHHKHHHHHHTSQVHEDSSVLGSRPVTPPTDYDSAPPRGARVSRKDDHHMRQSYLREVNGPNRGAMTMWHPNRKQPQGYYMVPVNSAYGAPTMPRARSVPPRADKNSKKEKKSKKKSSSKKKKNKSTSNGAAIEDHHHGDYTTTNLENHPGYERSFSRSAAERAFSKSLAADTRHSAHGDAYLINQNGVGEGEFPVMY